MARLCAVGSDSFIKLLRFCSLARTFLAYDPNRRLLASCPWRNYVALLLYGNSTPLNPSSVVIGRDGGGFN